MYRRLATGAWEEETRIPPPVPNPTDIAFGHSVHFAPDDPNLLLAGAVNSREFGAESWAQFFLKFILGHPAVTAITPATSQAKNMIDNIGGGIGRVPDEATRKRIAEFVDALPPPPPRNR